jgi:hypothetical protein
MEGCKDWRLKGARCIDRVGPTYNSCDKQNSTHLAKTLPLNNETAPYVDCHSPETVAPNLDPATASKVSSLSLDHMPSTVGMASLIPGLVNEVALEIFLYFVAIDKDGPCTLVLVCTAWRDTVLRSNSLKK